MTAPDPVQWVTTQTVMDYLGNDAPTDQAGQAQLASQIQAATEVLYALSGRQFPGQQELTVRPTARPEQIHDEMWVRNLSYYYGWGYGGWSQNWLWGSCPGCNYRGCAGSTTIGLGHSPIISIESIQINGEILDPSSYRVDDQKWLVRQDYLTWPTCQKMYAPLGDPATFGVDFTFGENPPIAGQNACTILSAELYKASVPSLAGSCQLPKRISSITRQGVSIAVLDPMTYLEKGYLGISSIDMFIEAYNPYRQVRKPMVFSPDMVNVGRRQSWP